MCWLNNERLKGETLLKSQFVPQSTKQRACCSEKPGRFRRKRAHGTHVRREADDDMVALAQRHDVTNDADEGAVGVAVVRVCALRCLGVVQYLVVRVPWVGKRRVLR